MVKEVRVVKVVRMVKVVRGWYANESVYWELNLNPF